MNGIDSGVLGFQGVGYLAPLWLLLAGVVALMVIDMFSRNGDGKDSGIGLAAALWTSGIATLASAASCLWLWQVMAAQQSYAAVQLFISRGANIAVGGGADTPAWAGAAVIVDRFGLLSCLAVAMILGLSLLTLAPYLAKHRLHRPELFPLLLLSALGMMLLALSRDLLLSFAAIELLSLPLYVLCALRMNDQQGRESSLKYFLLGAFASGFLIYGAALVYGAVGHLNYSAIAHIIANRVEVDGLLIAGLALVGVGFAFKLALVPFHAWVPDVYQGAPTPITGFMAGGVKFVVAVAFMRIIVEGLDKLPHAYWQDALVIFAGLSMLAGNLLALHQMSAKRLLACSAIAHSGYLAVGLAAGTMQMTGSMLVYLIGYALAASGVFALITYLSPEGQDDIFLDQAHSLYQRAPVTCVGLSVLMLSLGGFPLTLGFIGKLLVFRDAWQAGLVGLVIFALVNSVISFYYYLRFVMAIYMQPALPGSKPLALDKMPGAYAGVAIVTVVLTLLLGMLPGLLLPLTDSSRINLKALAGQPIALDVKGAGADSGGQPQAE